MNRFEENVVGIRMQQKEEASKATEVRTVTGTLDKDLHGLAGATQRPSEQISWRP